MKCSVKAFLTASLFLAVLFLSSCKKENSTQSPSVTAEESQAIAEENALADGEYEEITEIAVTADADLEIEAVEGSTTISTESDLRIRTHIFKQLASRLGPCAKITVSGDAFPKTVTIDYGDGCLCRDGRFRKGAIVLHFTAPLRRSGSVLTVTLRDYYVNRAHIEGIKTITNLSAGTTVKWEVKIQEGRVTWPNGRGFTYVGKRTLTQVEGMDTRTVLDNKYEIEGRNQTVYANGVTVIKNTETPLVRKVSCRWLVQGIAKIAINDRVLFVNFGNGECDNKAIISWAGGEKEISLSRWEF